MPLVRGLLLAHLCASALLLLLLWTVVLVQHVASRRSRGPVGVPAPRQGVAGAPAGPGAQQPAAEVPTASPPGHAGRGSTRMTSPSS